MESFFSSLNAVRTARQAYRSREQARSDVFDYIELFYNHASGTAFLRPYVAARQAGFEQRIATLRARSSFTVARTSSRAIVAVEPRSERG